MEPGININITKILHLKVKEVSDEMSANLSEHDPNRWTTENEDDFESLLLSQVTEILWKCCPPVIFALGTFGNVMIIVIMRRMSEGQSSHTMSLYFTALAVSDLVLLYTGLLRKWLIHMFNIDFNTFHDAICKLQLFFVNTCATISSWLIVSMTMQRVMSVVWPHYKSLSCTGRKVGFVIVVIVSVCTAINWYRLHGFGVMIEENSTSTLCTNTDDEGLKYFDWYIYPWIDLVVTSLIPFSLLIVGNGLLMWKVIQSVHVARVMTAGGCDQVNSRQKKASSLTLTLITVSMVFLLLSLPVCTFLIINPDLDLLSSKKELFTWAFCNLSWYVNSAINFYLYCLSGSRFRSGAKKVLCGPGTAMKIPTTTLSLTTSTNNDL